MSRIDDLRKFLADIKPGKVGLLDAGDVEFLLAASWHELYGSREGGMTAAKLRGRAEAIEWNPPILSFAVERHGGLVNGSTHAEIQHWRVDVSHRTAELAEIARRQIRPMTPRLDVKPLATEIAQGILRNEDDNRVKRRRDNCVRILTSAIIPKTNKQTTTGRRKRFTAELERLLAPSGWRRKDAGSHLVFERETPALTESKETT